MIQAVSGLPFSITTASPTPGTARTVNQVGPYQVTHAVAGGANPAVTWFNPTSFAAPTAGVLGGTGRNQFRGPAYFSDNLPLFNIFSIHEQLNLEARFDAFNMTNSPAFGLPNGSLGSNVGKITWTLGSGVRNVNGVGDPRVLEAGVKITF